MQVSSENISQNFTIKLGIIGGLLMAALLLAYRLTESSYNPFFGLSAYIVLAIFITYALFRLTANRKTNVFLKGLIAGNKLSISAAFILAISNLVLFFIPGDFSFVKYGLISNTLMNAVTVSVILIVETFVFGNIISFATMQYFKNNSAN